MASSATPWRRSPSSAPATRCSTTKPLKRAATSTKCPSGVAKPPSYTVGMGRPKPGSRPGPRDAPPGIRSSCGRSGEIHAHQELAVALGARHAVHEQFHGLDRAHIAEHLAQDIDVPEFLIVEQQLLLTSHGTVDVD